MWISKSLPSDMSHLILIPARGGSKRLPSKNIKPLCGRPLIYYTLDVAVQLAESRDICVSTDSDEIIDAVRKYGLQVPFKRPAAPATDMEKKDIKLITI